MKRTKGFAFDGALLALTKLATTLGSILTTKILSVSLELGEYGTYSQALLLVSLCASLISFGLSDSINYFYNRQNSRNTDKEQTIHTIFAIEILLGMVVIGAVRLFQPQILAYFGNNELKELLVFASVKPALENLIYMYQVLFVSIGKSKMIAIRNLMLSVGKVVCAYVAGYLFHDLWVIMAILVGMDVFQLVLFQLVFSKNAFPIRPHRGSLTWVKPILSYGVPMGIYTITNVLTRDIDKFVVSYLATVQDVAIYSNCSRVLPFDILATSLATVLIPQIVRLMGRDDKTEAVQTFKNYLKTGYYSVWILACAVIVVGDLAIPFLYSSEYLEGLSVFILYIFDSMMRFASMHLILTAVGKTKLLMQYSIVSLALNAVLNVALYYLLGLNGPAVATLISAGVYTILVLSASIKELGIRFSTVFDWKPLFEFIGKLVLTGVIFTWIKKVLLSAGWNQILVLFVVAGTYVVTNLILNVKDIKNVWAAFSGGQSSAA